MGPGKASERMRKAFPWCTLLLVAGAFISHFIVILGTRSTASAIQDLAASSSNWSRVGMKVGTNLESQLALVLENASQQLIYAAGYIDHGLGHMRALLSKMGHHVDAVIAENGQISKPQEMAEVVLSYIHPELKILSAKLNGFLRKMWEKLRPTLEQIGSLLIRFGQKSQTGVQTFSTSLDSVLALFNQVMHGMVGYGSNEREMLDETFNLFDMTNTGFVTVADLRAVSRVYSIPALSGKLSGVLMGKYDKSGDGQLNKDELGLLLHDPAIPDAMPMVLTRYASALAQVAGTVSNARMRDEMAEALVHYFHVVVAKNATQVQWVADRLGNGSLPLAVTADVMAELCFRASVVRVGFATADVGALVVAELGRLHPEYTRQALDLLANVSFWQSEGLQVADQPVCLDQITSWLIGSAASSRSNGEVSDPGHALLRSRAQELAEQHQHAESQIKEFTKQQQRDARSSSSTSQMAHALHLQLLGSASPVDPTMQSMVAQAINAGQPAAKETLEFARFLSANATRRARTLQRMCFDYSSQSNSPMDGFAEKISRVVGSVQTFLDMMMNYITPKGIDELEELVFRFVKESESDLTKAIEKAIWQALTPNNYTGPMPHLHRIPEPDAASAASRTLNAEVDGTGSDAFSHFEALYEPSRDSEDNPIVIPDVIPPVVLDKVSQVWLGMHRTLRLICTLLPTARKFMDVARKEVMQLAHVMNNIFRTVDTKAPPLFDHVAHFWNKVWICYFLTLIPISLFSIYYAAWSGGYMGGPSPIHDEELPRPKTLQAKLRVCWSASTLCMKKYHDTNICYWSSLLLVQLVIFLIFMISFVLFVLSLVKGSIVISCRHIELLNDDRACSVALGDMETFLNAYIIPHYNVDLETTATCGKERLLTCTMVAHKMFLSRMLTMIFSFTGTLFSLQLLIDSAIQHEQARFRRSVATSELAKGDTAKGYSPTEGLAVDDAPDADKPLSKPLSASV